MNRRQFLAAAAAAPFAVRAGIALADAPRLALATADTESRVVVVDAAAGRVLRSIPTLPGPRSVEAVAGGALAVVAHTAYGAVSILDAHRVRTVLRDFSEPRYAAAHPDGEHVYVTDSAASEVVAVGLARGRVLGRVRVGGWARHVTIDARGRTLWVGLGTASETVAVVDVTRPERPRLVRHVRPPVHAHDVGFAGAGVWVTSGDGRGLAVYDGGGSVRLRLPAGSPPQHVTFAEHVAYVTSGGDGILRVHALEDGRILYETAIPTGSYNVQAGHGLVLTPSLDHGTLSVLSRGGELLHRIDAAASCHDACFVRPA